MLSKVLKYTIASEKLTPTAAIPMAKPADRFPDAIESIRTLLYDFYLQIFSLFKLVKNKPP